MSNQEIDQKFAEQSFIDSCQPVIKIKVERDPHQGGYNAHDEVQGIDFDWDGDGWKNCGSPIEWGKTIQEAIDNLMEVIQERRAEKVDADDASFAYELKYTWS